MHPVEQEWILVTLLELHDDSLSVHLPDQLGVVKARGSFLCVIV